MPQITGNPLKFEYVPLDRLVPYPDNPRIHTDAQIDQIAASITEFGWAAPIVVDKDYGIVAGHGRALAAARLGLAEVPIVMNDAITEEQRAALVIADNQLTLAGGWNQPLLRANLVALETAGFKMPILGFGEVELRRMLGGAEPSKDADAPGKPEPEPIASHGDIWALGDHRIACASAADAETWARLMRGADRAAMAFTDPPYGVSYQDDAIINDDKRRDDLKRLVADALANLVHHTRDDAAFYIWHASSTRSDFEAALTAAGLVERQYLIWVKTTPVIGRGDFHWQHEPCFYASKQEHAPAFYGDRQHSTVWRVRERTGNDLATSIGPGVVILDGKGGELYVQGRVPKAKRARAIRMLPNGSVLLAGGERKDGTVWEVERERDYVHPTQKPVELARRAIEVSSQPRAIVLDAFLGSGSTLMAAELANRRCFGTELDPVYIDVTIRRWQELTGSQGRRLKRGDAAGHRAE